MSILQLLLILIVPYLAQRLEKKFNKIPAVLVCYGIGIILANTPLPFEASIFKTGYEVSVVLGITMVLILTKKNFFKNLDGQLLKAYLLHIICLLISILVISHLIETEFIKEKMAMIFAVATGGTANMNAIALAIKAPDSLFIQMNATDIFFSSIYLLLLLGLASIWRKQTVASIKDKIQTKITLKDYGELILKAIIVIALSALLSLLITGGINESIFLLALTTLSIIL